jgi:predicted amidophosphoribosyltransferase
MAFCISCAQWDRQAPLCRRCAAELAPGPRLRLASGLVVAAGLRHSGAARRLVHRLKYQGLSDAAEVLADHMAGRIPARAAALAPVPRAVLRRLRYGVDPAAALAGALSRRTGLPVLTLLRAPLWWSSHAKQPRTGRAGPGFVARFPAPDANVVLVDDVATSGATLLAAVEALGSDFRHGLTATAPGRVVVPAPTQAGEVAWRHDRT